MKILIWAPFINKVGTTTNVVNSITALKKYSKMNEYSIDLLNVFGEWNDYNFESLGVKVADPIVSTNPADFGDGLHISSLSSVSRKFQAGQLTNLSSKIQKAQLI